MVATSSPATSTEPLSEDQIYRVLSNERRRLVLKLLDDGDEIPLRDLANEIAALQAEADPPPRKLRQSVYVSLHQIHLPSLHELGFVEYDSREKLVKRGDRTGELGIYFETGPKHGITWTGLHFGIGFLFLLATVGAAIGVPGSEVLPSGVWSGLGLTLMVLSAGYRTVRRRDSIIRRLRRE